MKKQKTVHIYCLIALVTFSLSLSFYSCEENDDNDKEVPAKYIGTWERTEIEDDASVKQTLNIAKNSVIMNMKMNVFGQWIDLLVLKGNFSVDNDIFSLTISEIGVLSEDFSALNYYTPNDANWAEILMDEAEITESFKAKFLVADDKLTLIIDENEDGVYDPDEEGEVFTKV